MSSIFIYELIEWIFGSSMSDGFCSLNSTWVLSFFKCFKPSIETFHGPKIGAKGLFCPPIRNSKLAFCWVSPSPMWAWSTRWALSGHFYQQSLFNSKGRNSGSLG